MDSRTCLVKVSTLWFILTIGTSLNGACLCLMMSYRRAPTVLCPIAAVHFPAESSSNLVRFGSRCEVPPLLVFQVIVLWCDCSTCDSWVTVASKPESSRWMPQPLSSGCCSGLDVRSQWSNHNMHDSGAWDPRVESHCWLLFVA